VAVILSLFEVGSVPKTPYFGSYRTEFVCFVFPRIMDLMNMDLIFEILTPYERGTVLVRIGWLKCFNPCKPEGCWCLDLGHLEERVVAKMLAVLSTQEVALPLPTPSSLFLPSMHSLLFLPLSVSPNTPHTSTHTITPAPSHPAGRQLAAEEVPVEQTDGPHARVGADAGVDDRGGLAREGGVAGGVLQRRWGGAAGV